MTLAENPELAWLLIAVVAAAMVIGCLRVLGFEYYNAVAWYNLRLEVQALRRVQQRRLDSLVRNAKEANIAPPVGAKPGVPNPADPSPVAEILPDTASGVTPNTVAEVAPTTPDATPAMAAAA